MPDTGAPWNIPYVEAADLVSDWPADSLALANAIADGLDDAGRIIAVKHVLKTDTFSSSLAVGSSVAITGLSISHAVSNSSNAVILIADVNGSFSAGNSFGATLAADGTLISRGDAAGNRVRIGSAATGLLDTGTQNVILMAEHLPASTSSVTYDVRLTAWTDSTYTWYCNRARTDTDSGGTVRPASSLTLLEVRV
jgi:hypothetical protein